MYKSGNHSDLPYTKKGEKASQPFHPAYQKERFYFL